MKRNQLPPAPSRSWWADFSRPDQRAHFIEAAAARHEERTRAEDIKQGSANQMMRHIIAPRQYPASNRHRSVK